MASIASFLPLTIKKEEDILTRPTIIPKRKAAVNIPPRSRFAKARPNIGGLISKVSKEAQPSEIEKKNTVVKEDVSNELKEKPLIPNTDSASVNANLQASESESIIPEIQTVKKEPEISQRPSALPKRTLATPAAPRARYQKARPNIAALANKASKNGNAQKDRGRISVNEKENITDSPELKTPNTQDDIVKESVTQLIYGEKPIRNVEPVKGFSFSKGEMEVFPEILSEESIHLPNDVQHNKVTEDEPSSKIQDSLVAETLSPAKETATISPTSEDCVVVNLDEDEEFFETPDKEQQNQEKKKCNYVTDLTKTMSTSPTETVKEVSPPTPVMNKVMEYPTLKSILNSPRKRATTKKTYERKRRLANLSETPSRSEMTMTDLIYYNPTGEPMKVAKPQTCAVENLPSDENTKPVEEEPEEDESSNPPVPKVIINENGEIIIDESSLVVRRKETIDTSIEAIIENDNTTYSSFRKKSSRQWTNKETSKFYKALSLVGTDFALMENIFCVKGKVTRSRRELKLKFKREEKLRIELVHKAMYESQTYDLSILDDDPEDLEAEEVDDAPPEVLVVKKRGRKPKAGNENKPTAQKKKKDADLNEFPTDENNVYGILNEDSCSRITEVSCHVPESDSSKDTTPKSKDISRPQRVRKTKLLSDFVTDVDDSETSDGYISDSETITRKKPPDCSENSENNGQSLPVEKPAKARKRKQVLETEYFEAFDTQDNSNPSEMECVDVSRLGRVRRAKVLTDFITDEQELEETDGDSDDESVKGVGKKRKVQAFDEDSNEEYPDENGEDCIMVEHINCLPDTATMEVIERVKEEDEESPEAVAQQKATENNQNVVFLAAISSLKKQDSSNPTNNLRTKKLPVKNYTNNAQHPKDTAQDNLDCNKKSSSHESLVNSLKLPLKNNPTFVDKNKTNCGIPIQCIDLEQPNNVMNLLTDSVDSEVVITGSTKMKRARRRAAAPNVTRGGRPRGHGWQPRVEVETPHIQPSFSNFTPAEEQHSSPPKEIKTYSRNVNKEAQAGLQSQVNHLDPSTSIQNNNTIHDIGTSFQNSQTTQDRLTSLDNNQMILDTGYPSQYNQTILDPMASFPNSQTITLDSGGTTDPPPVMIFTKSPNNENILHLFMVSPNHTF